MPEGYRTTDWLGQPYNDLKSTWKVIEKTWKIAKNCFNDLGPAWTEHWEWRVQVNGNGAIVVDVPPDGDVTITPGPECGAELRANVPRAGGILGGTQ